LFLYKSKFPCPIRKSEIHGAGVSVGTGQEGITKLKLFETQVSRSKDGKWLVVELEDGSGGWIEAVQMQEVMGLTSVTVVPLPPTPTMNPTQNPTETVALIIIYPHADINKDCIVDERDRDILMSHWTGAFDQYGPNYHSRADLSDDGINPGTDGYIDAADYNYLIANWGSRCEYRTR
jgi:hypothetical protein